MPFFYVRLFQPAAVHDAAMENGLPQQNGRRARVSAFAGSASGGRGEWQRLLPAALPRRDYLRRKKNYRWWYMFCHEDFFTDMVCGKSVCVCKSRVKFHCSFFFFLKCSAA